MHAFHQQFRSTQSFRATAPVTSATAGIWYASATCLVLQVDAPPLAQGKPVPARPDLHPRKNPGTECQQQDCTARRANKP